ncbi:MAG: phenylalanine--tRNA ligase subunit beta [Peptoniphilaceae bacterium]|nr:phenylalanine--tRNA ligase subunit beta [Peptoniphilaceae bacterium]MDY6018455.1 phenylalanine--tRNA ligase subunit beta [Anaerococcus sp.]
MLIPLIWQDSYVKIDTSLKNITDRLSETGSHVEGVSYYSSDMENIVVGKVNSLEKHPNADRLSVLKIDVGKDKDLTIVTAATNVKNGDYLLVIKSGATLDKGPKIEDHDFFGITSQGMLLAYKEMNYPDSVIPKKLKDGVIVLSGKFVPGELASKVLSSNTPVIEYEITPNRPDCLSIIGMARETAASFGTKLTYPSTTYKAYDENLYDYTNGVEVISDDCKRFTARVIKDVEVKESPQWLQNYLILAGMRPINNIVDITNFVMLETGQPIHAYDLDKLYDKKIIVRNAKNGEKITTLDGEERELDESMLVIADGKEVIGLAGIMGSLNSEVTDKTKNILLESANFSSDSIRRTSKILNLRTEASTRFEKGIHVENAEFASKRVMTLVNELKAGKVIKGSIDLLEKKTPDRYVDLRISRLNQLIGRTFTKKEAIDSLELLEFEIEDIDANTIRAKVPAHRLDIEIEADLIEEVVRLYGMGKVESKPLVSTLKKGQRAPMRLLKDDLKINLLGQLFSETTTYSFISPKEYDRLGFAQDSPYRNYVKIINPLGEDYSVMRTTLMANMLDQISKNIKKKQDDIKFFEIGTIFENTDKLLPKESQALCMGLYGKYTFYDLKDFFLKAMKKTGFKDFIFKANENFYALHEGRCADIYLGGKKVGIMGQVSYYVADEYNIEKEVYLLEINLSSILDQRIDQVKYQPIGKYPAIERDYAFVCPRSIESVDIENTIRTVGKDLVKKIELFDIYTGNQIGKDKKSIAYKIYYKSFEKTLEEKDIEKVEDNILKALEDMGLTIRE